MGVPKVRSVPGSRPLPERLLRIHRALGAELAALRPDAIAVEKAFHGRNSASLIALGEGRGVALLCAAELGAAIHEYAPAEVKKAVTGVGGARKEQVAAMVRSLLGSDEVDDLSADATDALAIALCHHQRQGLGELAARTGGASSWRRRGRGR